MTRTTYVWDKDLQMNVPKDRYLAGKHNRPVPRNPDLAAPRIIADTMDPVQSMLDGKIYDSKHALRQTYRDAGVVEVGDDKSVTDPAPFTPPPPDISEIKAKVAKAYSEVNLVTPTKKQEANPI